MIFNRSLKMQSSSTVRLSVNRRLGKGCSTQLTFVKHDGSTSIFEHDYYDGTSIWTNILNLLDKYVRLLTNPPVLLGFLVAVFLMLVLLLLFMVVFFRRKSFRMSEFKLNSSLVSLKNIKKRYQNQTAKRFNARKNRANDKQMLATTEIKEDEVIQHSAPPPPPPLIAASCPPFVDIDHDRVDNVHQNEFHALREQLVNKN